MDEGAHGTKQQQQQRQQQPMQDEGKMGGEEKCF